MSTLIQLYGKDVITVNYDSEGKVTDFVLKFGKLYLPCQEPERLVIKDSGVEIIEGAGTHKNYYLDVTGWEFNEEYNIISKMIGVNFKEMTWEAVCTFDTQQPTSITAAEMFRQRYYTAVENMRLDSWT